jgi:hypothetical protein
MIGNGTTQKEGLARTPTGETQFLNGLLDFIRDAKKDRRREFSLAAAQWENRITFHILLIQQRFQRKRSTPHPNPLPVRGGEGKRSTSLRPSAQSGEGASSNRLPKAERE